MTAADNLAHMPAPAQHMLAPPKHSWSRESTEPLPPWDYPDGNARIFRRCAVCGMAKITVLVGGTNRYVGREWQTRDGKIWIGEATPPCIAMEEERKRHE